MTNLDRLHQWVSDEGVFLFDQHLPFSESSTKAATVQLYGSETWGIFLDSKRMDSPAEELSVLLHECGHYATGATHQLFSPIDLIERHEYKANKWAVCYWISAEELDRAVAEGYDQLWSLAEYFSVTEDFMRKALCWHVYGNVAAELFF